MKNATLFIILFSLLTSLAWAGNKAAMVKLLKGDAYVVSGKDKTKLKVNDWIESGSTVKTSAKSFLRVVFIDKSVMNIGASSEVKIERFHQKDAGVIGLVKGKIRSQVSKDYLQIDGKNRSKLFIKTTNAVMGIRGTDFLISTTGKNTVAILFEGSVVFNRLNDRKLLDSAKLDDVVDRGVRLFPGEFSAVGEKGDPTIPALLNVQQREKLEKNVSFQKNDKAISKTQRSIVPGGLSGSIVASRPSLNLHKKNGDDRASSDPDGYIKDGRVKPMNGSFVLIDSATIVQPGSDAILDESTNTYIASSSTGEIKIDGTFEPVREISTSSDFPVANVDVSTDYNFDSSTAVKIDTTQTIDTTVSAGSTAIAADIPISPVLSPTISAGSTVQVGETLNDAVTNTPIIGPTAGTATAPVTDAVDGTTEAAAETVQKTTSGISRLLKP